MALEITADLLATIAGFGVLAFTAAYAMRHREQLPKLSAYIELIRPFTLLPPLVAGTAFGLMGAASMGWANWDLLKMIFGVSALIAVNAASNTLNSVYDLEIDRINKPYRPLPRGAIDPHEALTLAWLLYLITLWRATVTNESFAGFVLIIMFLTIAYSAPPFRLKKRFIINNVSIALARGLFGVLAAWSIFGDPMSPIPWGVGAILFIFLCGAATTKDFNDIEGDRAYGVKTLPVVYGVERAATISAAFFVLPFAIIPMTVQLNFLYPRANLLVVLGFMGANVFRHTRDWAMERDKTFENNPMWRQMYILLMALALGFALTYLWP